MKRTRVTTFIINENMLQIDSGYDHQDQLMWNNYDGHEAWNGVVNK